MINNLKLFKTSCLLLIVITTDQVSKLIAYQSLFLKNQIFEINSFISFIPVWNDGISFGMFQNLGLPGRYFFTIIAFLISFWLIWYSRKLPKMSAIGYILIAGGAIGNALDRIIHGKVVDFIDFHYLNWHWPTFNIADSFIFIGVVLFLYNELFLIKGHKNEF
tara:strand:- start:105 stop:593 length:489 start_codon:yes stop_codon:yes gene_type:complete